MDGILGQTGGTIEDLSLARALNVAYSVLVNEAAERGVTRRELDKLLRTHWGETVAPEDEEAALADLMGGLTMDDLL